MPDRPIRIAAQLHPQQGPFENLLAAAVRADEMGYDVVYNWDHFYPLYGDADGEHHECFTTLAAFAQATERAEIGPLVACNSYRNPNLVADMARTIDHVSGGRFVLGLGSGWFKRDYEEYGYEFGTTASRIRDLGRSLPVIKDRLGKLNPPPVRQVPILIAGTGPTLTLPLVAQFADGWHARFPDHAEEEESAVETLLAACQEHGRDPSDIEWGLGVQPNDLDRFLAEEAPTLVEMGFTQFTLGFNGPKWSVDAGADWLSWRDQMNA
ncbi:MAG TPA: LLM class F420-dependent oxidoreductase [Acidimicrobiia bacterium]|nr:LLM class F420-dependent oxidoreductase [Acidimicrobiia bacterium]